MLTRHSFDFKPHLISENKNVLGEQFHLNREKIEPYKKLEISPYQDFSFFHLITKTPPVDDGIPKLSSDDYYGVSEK
ncbi:hypothetical protein VNO77_18039 [Canavalia gladiata]|uniref:Uncharacterized protein n=1 Tax=Canavalia gladiata TaxID=3824 RepID=A0AAN9LQ22_CANGL